MNDPQHDIRVWMTAELEKRGHGAKGALASHLNVRADAITRMANTDPKKETREIRAHELIAMKAFFAEERENPFPMDGSEVPLMGYLGAGAIVEPEYDQVPADGLEQIWLPIALPDEMVAFKVSGISMLPLYKPGAVIVVYRHQTKPLDSFYGEEAAVRTTDGRRFIKTIMRGQKGVTLTSWNAEPIEDVRLEWIGEIFAHLPPAALRKLDRQGGLQGNLRLKSA